MLRYITFLIILTFISFCYVRATEVVQTNKYGINVFFEFIKSAYTNFGAFIFILLVLIIYTCIIDAYVDKRKREIENMKKEIEEIQQSTNKYAEEEKKSIDEYKNMTKKYKQLFHENKQEIIGRANKLSSETSTAEFGRYLFQMVDEFDDDPVTDLL